ncbi:MAG: hypothetical protein ACPGVI_01190 [Crocinitomicaceae bacterium]
MKKNSSFVRVFTSISLSIMGILLCGSLFMYTATPAQANGAKHFAPRFALADFPPSTNGSIMMDYTSVHVPSQDKTYYECMVWDKNTGKSKLYFYSFTDKKFKAYEDNVQLPSSPIAKNSMDEVMMNYTSIHVPSEDKTYYECMVWNTTTGASKLYFYSFTDKKFKAYEDNVQLPDSPLH